MTIANLWQDFPAVTPPKNVPLWVTLTNGCVIELSYSTGERFYDDYDNHYEYEEVVAFIVLPGPKS